MVWGEKQGKEGGWEVVGERERGGGTREVGAGVREDTRERERETETETETERQRQRERPVSYTHLRAHETA